MNIDPNSKAQLERRIPEKDNRERWVCRDCSLVIYENPRIVVGTVVSCENEILLCRRAIEPRKGFWTVPAGFMELGETATAGALRELREEACADAKLDGLLAVYEILHLSQVQMFYRGSMASKSASAGHETLEIGWFEWDVIPWDHLAFETVHWVLKAWKATQDTLLFAPDTGHINSLQLAGSKPST